MTNLVKLTEFNIKTDWDGEGVPTNTEILTDVWINPDRVTCVKMADYFVPQKEKNTFEAKVLIAFGEELCIYVNESMVATLQIIQGRG